MVSLNFQLLLKDLMLFVMYDNLFKTIIDHYLSLKGVCLRALSLLTYILSWCTSILILLIYIKLGVIFILGLFYHLQTLWGIAKCGNI